MNVFVVDTSVAVKWFNQLNEGDTDQALLLLEDGVAGNALLITTDLLRFELANALAIGKRLPPSVVRAALERLERLPVQVVEVDSALLELATTFAQKYNISVYDAVYAGLAADLDGTLVTANPRHQQRVREAFVLPLGRYRKE